MTETSAWLKRWMAASFPESALMPEKAEAKKTKVKRLGARKPAPMADLQGSEK